ncbi:MAG: exosortase/archaeosortase family protein [Planctomycetaceae bacterium]|nr:exosortase/archaeosortase family protein [Planctomycetaceae bacterium]
MQENTTPDNEPSNPFQLNLNEIKPANEAVPVPKQTSEPGDQASGFRLQTSESGGQASGFRLQTSESASTRKPEARSPKSEMVMPDAETRAQGWLAFVIAMPVLAAILGYAYWSTLEELLQTWKNNIDYHHGFFVAPFVAYFLWVRRDTFPAKRGVIDAAFGIILGTALLLFWSVFRYYVIIWSMVTLDSWTILIWVWAVCLMCFGIRAFIWALPSLLFLAFMFPWPHRFEMQLREPLQHFAAQMSVYILRLTGEQAIAQANIVLMNDGRQLDVAAACSGIRVLVSVIAAAYAAVLLMRRPWWQNLLLFCMVVPVALFVNALRIAMTGLLIKHASEQVESFGFEKATPVVCDEISGTVMLFLTFVFFVVIVWWFGMVFRRVDVSEQQTRLRQAE